MADNVTLPGTGEVVATDDVGGRQYQRYKLSDGLAESEVHARVKAENPDSVDAGVVVRQAPEDIWSVSFTRASASDVNAPGMTQRRKGTGVTVTQSGGNLLVAMGTTANSEFLARSSRTFNGAFIERHQLIASQRIANTNFAIMLADTFAEGAACTINSATSISVGATAHGLTAENVGQSMFVAGISGANGVPGRYAIASIPDANTINFTVAGWPASGSCTVDLIGWNYMRWLYTGTGATTANVDSQRFGYNAGDTAATINTTASPGHMAQTAADGRNIYFQDGLVASSTAPALATRAHRWVNIPDQEVELRLYVWGFNGSTAPASSTTWTVGFVAVEDTVNTPVYLAGIRPQGGASPVPVVQTVAGPTQPVSGTFWQATQPVSMATNTPTLAAGTAAVGDVGTQYRATATGAASRHAVANAATTNPTVAKAGAGRLVGWDLSNTTASWVYLKLHNTASAPTAGASVVQAIGIPPNGKAVAVLNGGVGHSTGIAYTTVTGGADSDATAITAGAIVGALFFA
jgi:hypothetical protein